MANVFPIKKNKNQPESQLIVVKEERSNSTHDESNWLVSYADMMTLLCGFFIMLFSMAKLDAPQYDGFKEALAKQFGGEYKSESKETAKFVTQILQELGVEKQTLVKSDYSGVSILFESTVFFETLSSDIKVEGKKILEKFAEKISTRQELEKKKYKIVIEGHADSRPILSGLYPSNWELSAARSARVVRLFIEKGFQKELLTAIAYADTHPIVSERKQTGELDETALNKNRRVVIRILDPKMDSIPFPESDNTLTKPPATSAH